MKILLCPLYFFFQISFESKEENGQMWSQESYLFSNPFFLILCVLNVATTGPDYSYCQVVTSSEVNSISYVKALLFVERNVNARYYYQLNFAHIYMSKLGN